MSSYRRGYIIELKAKSQLKKLGAKIVVRSSRSRTPIDLIAIFPDRKEIWLIQCKAKREAPKNLDKLRKKFHDLVELSGTYTVHPVIYMKKERRYQFMEL